MDVRRRTEEIEHLTFAPWATFSDASRGRVVPEPQDPLRPVFQRDRDRVLHCKAFRRLKQKTQVFLSPEGDLYRTRLTHTLEVSQIARTIARGLRLNEDLTEAISLAHDLGHTPFGHAGEKALNDLCPDGFHHYMQSLRVVDRLEKDGEGLNLTWEVRNGIVTHTKGTWQLPRKGASCGLQIRSPLSTTISRTPCAPVCWTLPPCPRTAQRCWGRPNLPASLL